MAFAKCQGNRFKIDGEITENHAIYSLSKKDAVLDQNLS